MNRILSPILAMAASLSLHAEPTPAASPTPAATSESVAKAADSAAGAEARSATLELAGAFSNDGYKIRDSFYFGDLEQGASAVIEVNLFAGNEYWFCAAGNAPARKVSVKVYNEEGALVANQQYYDDGAKGAAGLIAPESGKYLVKVTLTEGEKSQFCFLYCYK